MTRKPSIPSIPTLNPIPDERTATEVSENGERNRDTTASKPRILRRSYLKLLGVSTVPLAVGGARASEGSGYGEGGYGEGGYGGIEDDDGTDDGDDDGEEPEIGEPVIEYLHVADTSQPNPHVDLEVEWSVSHDDDALEEVRIVARTDNDRLVDSVTLAVDGSSASGSETFRIRHGSGETYVVSLTVRDQVGNMTGEDATIST